MKFPEFLKEEKAQVSAELIIIIAALIAVALILLSQLRDTAKEGKERLESETRRAWKIINETERASR